MKITKQTVLKDEYRKKIFTWSKKRELERSSMSEVIVSSPFNPRSSSLSDLFISAVSKFILSHS
jgi:hypothetical protein